MTIRQEDKHQRLLELLPPGRISLWSWDRQKDRIVIDKDLTSMFGMSPEQAAQGLTPREFFETIYEDDRSDIMQLIDATLQSGKVFEHECRIIDVDGNVRWVIARGIVERNKDEQVEQLLGVMIDISSRKIAEADLQESEEQLRLTNEGLRREIKKRRQAERKLRTSSKELSRSNKELEEFAYISSHDLQEPLRKIIAFSDLLIEEYRDSLGGGKEYLDRIQDSARRMSTLIEDLLTFSRVTTKPVLAHAVDLNLVAQSAIADLQERIEKEKGSVVIQPDLPVVMADETHMRQLFQNLISNALKFHPPERTPVVTVSATQDKNTSTIMISDNGIGIEDEYKEKVFTVFQRLNAKHAYEGTGIGLAVCRKIVDTYGGAITIDSQLGRGTTFNIMLPIRIEE